MERLGTDFGAGAPIGERVKTESECSPGHRRTQGRSRWAEIRRETRTQRIREQGTGEPAEEAVRLSHERIEAGERTTQTGVTLLQTGLEAVQRNIELTLGLIKDVSEHNIRGCAELLGSAGDEAQRETSARRAEVTSANLSDVSSEWLRILLQHTQRGVERWNTLIRSRSPQEFINAQNSVLRDNLEDSLHAWQVVANGSLRLSGTLARMQTVFARSNQTMF
jgi:hypothetical protein